MKKILLIGSSGFIGGFLKTNFSALGIDVFCADIKTDPYTNYLDIRKPIKTHQSFFDIIFLLAAIHREPGHIQSEFFDTNFFGAKNVANYATAINCNFIFFVSSISVYGPTNYPTDESVLPMPNSSYGVSKLAAELVLQGWQKESPNRRLIICRPGVVFGENDPGNIGRTIQAVRNGFFIYPGKKTIRKSYAYIKGLFESIVFTLNRHENFILYNYVESETETLKGLCKAIAEEYKCSPPRFSAPISFLLFFAYLAQFFLRDKNPFHPVRVHKAALPTHIIPKWLIDHNFPFKWNFRTALRDMMNK